MRKRDGELGMDRAITRRDFMQGAAVAAGAAWMAPRSLAGEGRSPGAASGSAPGAPPTRTGMRGSHDGSWEVAHALRDGESFPAATPTGEHYDLIVVGGGISGLSAAWFYRERKGLDARILILENHDDCGGHAKRNEFTFEGRTWIGYGGSESMENPGSYSAEAKGLLKAVGIEVERFYEAFDQDFYARLGMSPGDYFNEAVFGRNVLLARGERSWSEYVGDFPLSPGDRRILLEILSGPRSELARMAPDALEDVTPHRAVSERCQG